MHAFQHPHPQPHIGTVMTFWYCPCNWSYVQGNIQDHILLINSATVKASSIEAVLTAYVVSNYNYEWHCWFVVALWCALNTCALLAVARACRPLAAATVGYNIIRASLSSPSFHFLHYWRQSSVSFWGYDVAKCARVERTISKLLLQVCSLFLSHTHTHMNACTHTHTKTCEHMHSGAHHSHTYTHTHTHRPVHICILECAHTHTRTHTYTHRGKKEQASVFFYSGLLNKSTASFAETYLHQRRTRHFYKHK